jgi:dethiobiotin synthetase
VINHLLLTVEHASCKGLLILGDVLNCLSAEISLAGETNREVLSGLTGVPCLAELPFYEAAGTEKFLPCRSFDPGFDFRRIESALS